MCFHSIESVNSLSRAGAIKPRQTKAPPTIKQIGQLFSHSRILTPLPCSFVSCAHLGYRWKMTSGAKIYDIVSDTHVKGSTKACFK